ncbi:MAG: HlyD family efflux transporter periplasmic adaptor subunit [Planctomycetaceae bacterium]|nr:HlyD family efflux transporter periplasmic adaptor subunit [Planctomycetales bacterium]MCB9923414.1 HlyD family efflux transporter periplasmic adaptor subunit [Planctomycetaceae bacterium]
MRGHTSPSQLDDNGDTWSEIESLVDATAKLAQRSVSDREFCSDFVRSIVQATNAHGAAVWTCGVDDQYVIAAQIEPPDASGSDDSNLQIRRGNILEVARNQQATQLLARQSDSRLRNPMNSCVILQPVMYDEQSVAVVEVFHEEPACPRESTNTAHVVAVFGDLLADFYRSRELRRLRSRASESARLQDFVEQIHRSVDLKHSAFSIANEMPRVLVCDRVTVLDRPEHRCRALAISGLDTFDRRSPLVRAAERMALAVTASGETLWYPDGSTSLPPQLEARLQAYLDAAHVRSLAVVAMVSHPDGPDQQCEGVLLVERFESSEWNAADRSSVEVVCRHSTTALRNANALARLPLIGVNRLLKHCLRPISLPYLPKTLAWAVALSAMVAALIWVPVDFNISGEGQLLPIRYRHVFAPADGVIENIQVQHASTVTEGTVLLQMRRPLLELEETRLLGEVLTNQKRLDSIRSALLNHRAATTTSASEFNELTSEEARLQVLLASLQDQREILAQERAQLDITSPIDGEVITWSIEDTLSRRPVRRGERLVSIVDPNGPWELELRIADRDIEHVLTASREFKQLNVSFVVVSHAGEEFSGVVESVAIATELDEHQRPTVLLRVAVDPKQLPQLRPGARVNGKVQCGRRSIGFVWFRDLLDAFRTHVLF